MAIQTLFTTFAAELKTHIDMTALLVLAALVVIALVGWAIAEAKAKTCTYHNNEEEEAALERTQEAQKKSEYAEMSIRDVIKTISTKGFKAV